MGIREEQEILRAIGEEETMKSLRGGFREHEIALKRLERIVTGLHRRLRAVERILLERMGSNR